ncbi:sigma-70 family RNA polymerase sigma factor [Methylobacterium iners]|uniref:RNA polymerase sigma factor n=1 Tax=Methylobacterium iners TaxID=418707 RepID=A0ABQ4RXN9_9HYPH|nr:sigma-70 family RNA polymerase sigma factor [Methylobacterium iners]GJD95411.1 hypothetical protein OCOJLMKI_2623 [Methylobacterium iners]
MQADQVGAVLSQADRESTPVPTCELPRQVQYHLGAELKGLYAALIVEEQPRRFLDLIAQLDASLTTGGPAIVSDFRKDLVAALPGLRAFALSLTNSPTQADDLLQETLLKAWQYQSSFQAGTNFMAWLCTIMRNHFYSVCRKRKREVEDADGVHAGKLVVLPAQEHRIELQQVWTMLAKLPLLQREALLLVGAQGLTYEAAAEVTGCQVGTAKSRVCRARAFLAGSLGLSDDRLTA